MKGFVALVFAVIVCSTLYAQKEASTLKALDLKEIKVGEPMPDIPLGDVMNNSTGKTRFSEFKGKLVILDFWDVTCVACIKGMPKMAKLQEDFKDQIQVFFVNYSDTKENITEWLPKTSRKKLDAIIPPNIPSIINAKHLKKIFPSNGEIGYHVWVDGNGIVRLKGPGQLNTYEEKIRDLLSGKSIDFVTDNGLKAHRKNDPLFSILANNRQPELKYLSLFSSFTDEKAPYYGTNVLNQIDSIHLTRRNSFLNTEALDLYKFAAKVNLIDSRIISGNRIILLVNDTSKYTRDRGIYKGQNNDRTYRDSRFCYEQIAPLSLSDTICKQYMLEDLNRYFNNLRGLEGRLETRKMSCYILVRTSKEDKLKTKGISSTVKESISDNGKKMLSYHNVNLKKYFDPGGTNLSVINKNMFPPNYILFDETGYDDKVDIELPDPYESNNNFEDLRNALQKYDLDIIKEERDVKMLVIMEKDYKKKQNN